PAAGVGPRVLAVAGIALLLTLMPAVIWSASTRDGGSAAPPGPAVASPATRTAAPPPAHAARSPAGDLSATAATPDGATLALPVWATEEVQEVVPDADRRCRLRFVLRARSRPVPGLVREPDGSPAAAAIVLAASTIGDPIHLDAQLPRRVRCDDQGRFQLLGVP